jgi:hypothetical protein
MVSFFGKNVARLFRAVILKGLAFSLALDFYKKGD